MNDFAQRDFMVLRDPLQSDGHVQSKIREKDIRELGRDVHQIYVILDQMTHEDKTSLFREADPSVSSCVYAILDERSVKDHTLLFVKYDDYIREECRVRDPREW